MLSKLRRHELELLDSQGKASAERFARICLKLRGLDVSGATCRVDVERERERVTFEVG